MGIYRPRLGWLKQASILALVAVAPQLAEASPEPQQVTVTVGQAFTLDSEILGEERPVLVSLPRGYAEGEAAYPVLILLDGSPETLHLARACLSDRSLPELVIAAVPNVDRIRDLSHRSIGEIWPTSGGADAFLAFLADELAPWLDANFRTTGYRIIHGGSAAGRFALYALLERPGVFDAVVARSPMLGTEFELLTKSLATLCARTSASEHFLYMVYGSHDYPGVTVYAEGFLRLLEDTAPSWLRFGRQVLDGKGHYQFAGLNVGLTALFADNGFPAERFLVQGSAAVARRVAKISTRFRSEIEQGTIDGERAVIDAACDLGRQRRFSDALRVLEYGLTLHPESPAIVYYLAQTLEHAGREHEAVSAYRRVFELEPTTGLAGMTRMLLDNLAARTGKGQ